MSKKRFELIADNKDIKTDAYEAVLVPVPLDKKAWKTIIPTSFSATEKSALIDLVQRRDLKFEASKVLVFHRSALQRWIFPVIADSSEGFALLGFAKDLVKGLKETQAASLLLDLRALSLPKAKSFLDAFVSALIASGFKAPRYSRKKDESKAFAPKLNILLPSKKDLSALEAIADNAADVADGTNLVRELAMQAANDLAPKAYVDKLKKLAGEEGLAFEFLGMKRLRQMGAGAFVAVAQGSTHEDSGIVKLSYAPAKKGKKNLTLVGKGVTFDTGGTNLKSAAYMYGMHRDMAGSAVATALVRLAARQKWPFAVTAYLAIADNSNGPDAYRPNDVVTAMSGRTIEIVHTDAEGRMMLADTLHLASLDKPDLILDYATLTGACVGAIGSNYSGAFTNRDAYHAAIIQSGQVSGERVWPFPIDEDYGECLKSDIADTKQCRLTGGVDHIEAAIFLKSFLKDDVPWIHVDLSSADHAGGLAHVDTEVTGFGLRFTQELLRQLWPELMK